MSPKQGRQQANPSTTGDRQSNWLDTQTLAVVLDQETLIDGFPVHTRILRTSFHKPLLRSETRYLPATESTPRIPLSSTLSVANEFIVRLAPGAKLEELSILANSIGAQALPIGRSLEHARIVFPRDSALARLPFLSKSLETASSVVRYVEPDYLLHTATTVPDDPLFSDQENLNSPKDIDIDAPEAWAVEHDANEIVIAIIDSGIRSTHEDLASNLWRNPLESANGIDDDGNGVIDDLHGLNAITDNGAIDDDNGHGTHVAGIAGAQGNNHIGIAGVAWDAQLLPLKFLDSTGFGTTSDAIECIDYARAQAVDVINNSWSGSTYSQSLYDALAAASQQGILIATAAGNESHLLDTQATYPAAYSIPNQLVVVATDEHGRLAHYSNHSPALAHIAAPGHALSTFNGSDSDYVELVGTSMATPHVVGALALLKAHLPDLSPSQLTARLLDAADISPQLSGKVLAEGRLNLHRALLGENNAPANDPFANATSLPSEGGRISGSTTRATKEAGETLPSENAQGHSVWHKWTPERDGRAQVSLAPIGFAATIALYEGHTLSDLAKIAEDKSTQMNQPLIFDIEFQFGKTYYFQVDTTSAEHGPYSLELALAAENDAFAMPTQLSGSSFSVQATNRAASLEAGETPLNPSASDSSVWFMWTAPTKGDFYLRAQQTNSQMFTAVFTGDSVTDLTRISTNAEDRNPGNVLFHAQQGQTYRFAVDSLAKLGSPFRLEGSYLAGPRIVAQPQDQSLSLGSSARFSVSVLGTGQPTYQWFKNGIEIPGANSSTLRIQKIEQDDFAAYQVRIKIASRTLHSRIATLSPPANFVSILQQPGSKTLANGDQLRLSTALSGVTSTTTYQWYKDGTPLSEKNEQTLQIESVSTQDTGFYTLEISDGPSRARSLPAYVLVSKTNTPEAFAWTQFHPNFYRGKIHQSGGFLIADESDFISFSTDGSHWQFPLDSANQATFFDGFYYAARDDGIYRSSNMMQWERTFSEPSTRYYGIVSGNGVLLSYTSQKVLRSTDGTNWSDSLQIRLQSLGKILFGNGKFVIKGPDDLKVSEDGLVWKSIPRPEATAYKLFYGTQEWWMTGGNSDKTYTSSDAETWKIADLPFDQLYSAFPDPQNNQTYLVGITEDPDRYSIYSIDLFRKKGSGIEFVQNLKYGYDTYFPSLFVHDGQILVTVEEGAIPLSQHPADNRIGDSNAWWKNSLLYYANDKFLAAHGSTLRSSPDGTNWKTEYTSQADFGNIVYGNGLYVGSNHYGNELRSLQAHNQNVENVAYTNKLFVGIKGNGIYYSTNGATWTAADTAVNNISKIAAGGGVFLAYHDSTIYRSTNGIQWSQVEIDNNGRFEQITYGNNLFMTFNRNQCYTSPDGKTWQVAGKIQLPNVSTGDAGHLFFTQGKFIATFSADTFFESVDGGTSWQQLPFTSESYTPFGHLSYAASPQALLMCSKLGIGIIGAPSSSGSITRITSPANQLSINAGTPITISFDTIAGTERERTEVFVSGTLWKTLAPSENVFSYSSQDPGTKSIKVISYDKEGHSSQDTIALTVVPPIYTSTNSKQFRAYDVEYFQGAFYAASDGGRIYTSPDGINWKGVQTPALGTVSSLAANDSVILASHSGQGILYSTNGVTWSNLGDFDSQEVSFDKEAFIAGSGDRPYLSSDGKSWTNMLTGEILTGSNLPAVRNGFVFNTANYGTYATADLGKVSRISDMEKVVPLGDAYLGLKSYDIYYSESLTAWSEVGSSDDDFDDIEVIEGIAFAKTGSGISQISGDGKNWIPVNETFSNNYLSYSDGYYYALSYGSTQDPRYGLIRSSNGIDWTDYGPAIKQNTAPPRFTGITASPVGVLVTSASDDFELYFVNAEETIQVSQLKNANFSQSFKLIGPNGRFAITNDESFEINDDGTWSKTQTRMEPNTVYANGVYVGSWHFGEFRSVDGNNWTQFQLPSWIYKYDNGADVSSIFSEGSTAIWIEIYLKEPNANGQIEQTYAYLRSTDGINWIRIIPPTGVQRLSNAYNVKGSTYYFEFGYNGSAYRLSNDLKSWQAFPIDTVAGHSVAQTKEYIATLDNQNGPSARVSISSDGTNWSTYDLPATGYAQFTATNEAFYLLGDKLWNSPNGKDWSIVLPYRLNAAAAGDRIIYYGENDIIVETATNDLAIQGTILSKVEYAVKDTIEVQVTLTNRGSAALSWPAKSTVSYAFTNALGKWSLAPDAPGFSGTVPIPFTSLDLNESKSFTFETQVPSSIVPDSYYLSLYLTDELIPKDGNTTNNFFTDSEATPVIIPARTLTIPSPPNGSIEGLGLRKSYAWKEQVLLSAVPNFGYKFSGWTGDRNYAEETLLLTLENDINLQASFTPKQFNLEIQVEGTGTVEGIPETQTVAYGQDLNLIASPANGWTFLGWEGYGQNSSSSLTAKVGRNLKLKARFAQLFADWAKSQYGDDPQKTAPNVDPENTGLSNMERFALGFDYPEQRELAKVGFHFEQDELILRYTLIKNLIGFTVVPYWSNDATNWRTTELSNTQIGETENLSVYEARLPLSNTNETSLLSIRISVTGNN